MKSEEAMIEYYSTPKDKKEKPEAPDPITFQQDPTVSWKQETLNKMETVFDNRYKFFDKASVDMVDSILNTDNCITVPGKLLALEITKQNQALTQEKGHWLMMAAAFVFIQPFLRG